MVANVKPELRNQTALVSGAGRGIGRAIAVRLAEEGCRVAALARTESELAETVEQAKISAWGARTILPIPADVTRDADLEQAVQQVIQRLGRITILVNNA